MNWEELKQRIRVEIRPRHSAILKSNGNECRVVTLDNGRKIGMRTGVKTDQSKAVTSEKREYADETLFRTGRFDSANFRARFKDAYAAGPCRFSMTGGLLVELGIAEIVPSEDQTACSYVKGA